MKSIRKLVKNFSVIDFLNCYNLLKIYDMPLNPETAKASLFGWAQVVWNSFFSKKVDSSSTKNLVTFTTISFQPKAILTSV